MAPPDQFVLFGDSLTQGAYNQSQGFALGAELQSAYNRRMDVVNRGYSGYNTDNALQVIDAAIPTPEQASMKFLVIWFGANDANPNIDPIPQYVPAERYEKNLEAIINHLAVKAHSPKIILLTPPPIEESVLRSFQKQMQYRGEIRRNKVAKAYAEIVKTVALRECIEVLDVWSLFMESAGWKPSAANADLAGSEHLGKNAELAELLSDGLHLTPKGYKLVFDGLAGLIRTKWPEYTPYKMPYKLKVNWELNWEKEKGEKFWDINNIS